MAEEIPKLYSEVLNKLQHVSQQLSQAVMMFPNNASNNISAEFAAAHRFPWDKSAYDVVMDQIELDNQKTDEIIAETKKFRNDIDRVQDDIMNSLIDLKTTLNELATKTNQHEQAPHNKSLFDISKKSLLKSNPRLEGLTSIEKRIVNRDFGDESDNDIMNEGLARVRPEELELPLPKRKKVGGLGGGIRTRGGRGLRVSKRRSKGKRTKRSKPKK